MKNRQNHLFSLCFDSDKVISHTDDTDRWRYHYHVIPLTLVSGRDSSHIDYASPDLSPETTQSVDVEPSPGQRPGCLRRLVIRFPGAHFRFRMCCCCCLWRCWRCYCCCCSCCCRCCCAWWRWKGSACWGIIARSRKNVNGINALEEKMSSTLLTIVPWTQLTKPY